MLRFSAGALRFLSGALLGLIEKPTVPHARYYYVAMVWQKA